MSIVDASVSVHPGEGPSDCIRALVFHHHPHFTAPTEGVPNITAELHLCGIADTKPSSVGGAAQVKAVVTRVGVSNANFWPLWWADQKAANLSRTNGDYNTWSAYSDAPPLASKKAHGVFEAGLKAYQAAAVLKSTSIDVVIGTDSCARVRLNLPVHEVALVEIMLGMHHGQHY